MTLVSLEKIERHFGDLVVLDGASMRVEDKDRIGIIGGNGVGKTTMIRILAGVDEPDRGARNIRKYLIVGDRSNVIIDYDTAKEAGLDQVLSEGVEAERKKRSQQSP